ncbi:hypothetical protein RRG08_019783 [Elysia crispata]|uniref:Uncharacterized protein n=1 Tax=Elysia crispata TaxID=231223 RepID=A0AAE1AW60_9GAST|nr:hypothetical protein RRG08_019783 [Elysia crispata]
MLATVLPTTTMENITSLDTALLSGTGDAGNRIAHNNHGEHTSLDTALLSGMGDAGNRIAHNNHEEHHVTRYGALVGDGGCWQPYCPQQPWRTSRH